MKIKHHQIVDLTIVTLFTMAALQSVLFHNGVLERLSMVSVYVMLTSIILGIILAVYIHFTKDQIFDPLSSELDSDPDDIEG